MKPPIPQTTSPERLIVVDPRLDDYVALVEPLQQQLVRLTLTTTGRCALRLLPSFADALWLLNPHLPDMSGLDLLEMLRSLQRDLKTVVVDDQYDERREQRALELRAIQYVCKPSHVSWIRAWQGELACQCSQVHAVVRGRDSDWARCGPDGGAAPASLNTPFSSSSERKDS